MILERRMAARGLRAKPSAPLLLAVALLLACQPAAAPTASDTAQSGPAHTSKSLVIAIVGDLGPFVLQIQGRAGTSAGELDLAVNQWLVDYDERATARPMLAAELPSRERGTWLVRPDGSMQTIYRLRPGVTWHDGHPFTAQDLVFSWRVFSDPDLPVSKSVVGLTSAMTAVDDHTIAIEWKTTYPGAGTLAVSDIVPLPRHLIESAYLADLEQFQRLPYWTEQFAGVGPYQVAEYNEGSHLILRAYPGFYKGIAKIDRIEVKFLGGSPAIVASLLAGSIDGALPGVVEFDGARTLQQEWEGAGKRPLIIMQPESWRYVAVQFRDPVVREVFDVRVRRALLHAIDREAISAALTDGLGPVSQAPPPPSDPRWDGWGRDVVAQYPYDPRQSERLLAEAGWRRGGGGNLTGASGGPLSLPLWTNTDSETTKTISIIGDYWNQVGAQVEQTVVPVALYRDTQYRASFPAFLYAGITASDQNFMNRVAPRACPSAETRWQGQNLGCYQNAEVQRIIDGFAGALEPAEQRELWRGFIKAVTEDLPVLPMYYRLSATVFREGITGVMGQTTPQTRGSWNIAEWDVQK
ncbi:MAG: hypothetical protein HW416_494 [Chloroflexi bacterium]|nr:hypothetical protein [Chloroflexota bacterium]